MSYFKSFPSIYYDLNRDEKYKLATDVLRRVTFNSVAKNHDSLFVKYDVTEGETPEEIAHNLYDNHTLYWVILLFNDIINKNKEWPMDAETLDRYIGDKYPGTAFYTTFDDSSLDENLISISSGSCSVATNDVYRTGVHTISEGFIATNDTDFDASTKKATITKWDPSFKRFIIDSMTDGTKFERDDTVYIHSEDGTLVKAIGTVWKVSLHSQTVNKFIDDNGNTLNQLGSYDGPIQRGEAIQKTATESGGILGGACSNILTHALLPFEDTLLGGSYMDVNDTGISQTLLWMTNYEEEQKINDEKRSINLLRPEVITDVITQFDELISL